jgi:hypothetical protein
LRVSTSSHVEFADVIVTGTLIDMKDPPQKPIMSSAAPITYTVQVRRTFKGEPRSELQFTSAMSGASCGLEDMEVDRRYTFFLDTGKQGMTATLCGGTTAASDRLEKQITQRTGPPGMPADLTTPTTSPEATTGPEPNAPRESTTAQEDYARQQPALPLWTMAAAAGGLALLAAAGAWLWRRSLQKPKSNLISSRPGGLA